MYPNMTDDQLENAIEMSKKFSGFGMISAIIMIMSLFFGFVISMIAGLIMKKTQEKIQQLELQILENHVTKEKELLITEMKKIGIEKLPYSYSALKQFIDPETMSFHYNKHYKGYVDKLNDALSKKKYGDLDLEKIIKTIT